jgi:PadR family transcriptional regulator AphA
MSGVARVILGGLLLGPKSGYEIKQLVDKSTRFFWAASYGQIYPELKRLREQGLVEGEESASGGRRRVVFSLTPAGHEALRDWLLEPGTGYELRDEGLLKLFFADALEPAEALELVRRFRAQRQEILDRLRAIQRSTPQAREGCPAMVLDYGIGNHEWIVAWCDEMERRLTAATHEKAEVSR